MSNRTLVLLIVAVVLFAAGIVAVSDPANGQVTPKPNVLLIVTDDQRADTLSAMPTVVQELAGHGTKFTDARVVNPMCCPSRAAILKGQYSHTHGVYGNQGAHGGVAAFPDNNTLATSLKQAGYETALVGKYMNGYGYTIPGSYIPPGWNHWFARMDDTAVANNDFYDYNVSDQGKTRHYGNDPSDYLGNVLTNRALEVINGASDPFFLYYTTSAPHFPATPEDQYARSYNGIKPHRPASYNEADISDKPSWLKNRNPLGSSNRADLDALRENQLESLQSVDEDIGKMLDLLREQGELSNTIVIFTSDNGYLWGEHRLEGKSKPYEEAIRVPLVIRFDSGGVKTQISGALATNIDLAPTIAAWAGAEGLDPDGKSMVPILTGTQTQALRQDFLVESMGKDRVTPWCLLYERGSSYTLYGNGEEEFYNLNRDPLQLENVAKGKDLSAQRQRLRSLCNPRPPGY